MQKSEEIIENKSAENISFQITKDFVKECRAKRPETKNHKIRINDNTFQTELAEAINEFEIAYGNFYHEAVEDIG